MRTFHIGGTAQVAEQSFFESRQRRRGARSPAATRWSAPDGHLIVMSRNTAADRPGRWQGPRSPTSRPTARACASRTARRSSAASAWPNGTPTPPRSSPKWAARCGSRTWWRACRSARKPTKPPASPTAWSSTGAPPPRARTCVRPWRCSTTTAPTSASPTAARPVTCCRWARSSRSATATK